MGRFAPAPCDPARRAIDHHEDRLVENCLSRQRRLPVGPDWESWENARQSPAREALGHWRKHGEIACRLRASAALPRGVPSCERLARRHSRPKSQSRSPSVPSRCRTPRRGWRHSCQNLDLHNAYFGALSGPRRLLGHECHPGGARKAPLGAPDASAAGRDRGFARRRRSRHPADGVGATASGELARARRRTALRRRSHHRGRRCAGPARAGFRHVAAAGGCLGGGCRSRPAEATGRSVSPDGPHGDEPLHRHGGSHHRRPGAPASARRDRRSRRIAPWPLGTCRLRAAIFAP